jgi:UDP-glucose 4-epimerase
MKVLVTGASAPLGDAIVQELLVCPDATLVLAVDRPADQPITHPGVIYRGVDLTHPRAVHDLLHGIGRDLEIDTVIHAAQHRGSHDDGRRVHAQNVEATRALLTACEHHPTVRRFVQRSFGEVYAQHHATTTLIDEDAPLEFDPTVPQWLRDRVEADLTACAHQGGTLQVAVLRCAELLAPETGSQLWDYLSSRVCLRPLGFDPVINVLALADAAAAFVAAVHASATGAFNIPGADTLPLSSAIEESSRADIPVPGPLMAPLYKLRRAVAGFDFRYDLNVRRFHFGGVLDGERAARELGYVPRTRVTWPRPWWRTLLERLAQR